MPTWKVCVCVCVCVCVRARLCLCVCLCVRQIGWVPPRGQSLGNRRAAIRCLSKTAFNEIHKADTQPSGRFSSMWPACVKGKSGCVHVDYEWAVKSRAFVGCVCAWVQSDSPRSSSSSCCLLQINYETEIEGDGGRVEGKESISLSSSPWLLYESTNCFLDCLNKWHKANESELSDPLAVRWSGLFVRRPPFHKSPPILHILCLLHSHTMNFISHVREINPLSLLWSLTIFM